MRSRATHVLLLISVVAIPGGGVELKSATLQVFEDYVQVAESRMEADLRSGTFLRIDVLSAPQRTAAEEQLRRGAVLVERVGKGEYTKVPNGLVHHWVGTAFIPGVTLQQTLALVQDYDRLPNYYQPEVVRSHVLARDGEHFSISMRLRKKKVVTVILDTDYDVHYFHLDATRAYSRSHSTRVAEIANAGEQNEHALPVGNDHGFMWRLNSYWRFAETDEGVYVQCEAISLTRDVPAGLGWLVGPFVKSIPQESLRLTLSATRQALTSSSKSGAGQAGISPAAHTP